MGGTGQGRAAKVGVFFLVSLSQVVLGCGKNKGEFRKVFLALVSLVFYDRLSSTIDFTTHYLWGEVKSGAWNVEW